MNFTEQLRAIDDAGFDVYQYRIVMHVWRVGECWEGVRTMAKKCGMSTGKVSMVVNQLLADGHLFHTVTKEGKVALKVCSCGEQTQQLNRSPREQRSYSEQKRSPHEQAKNIPPLGKRSPHELKINEPIEDKDIYNDDPTMARELNDMINALRKATKTKYGAGFNEEIFEQAASMLLRDGVTIAQVESFPAYWRELGWGGSRGLPTLEKVVEEMDNCINRVDTRPASLKAKLNGSQNGHHKPTTQRPEVIDPTMPTQGGAW